MPEFPELARGESSGALEAQSPSPAPVAALGVVALGRLPPIGRKGELPPAARDSTWRGREHGAVGQRMTEQVRLRRTADAIGVAALVARSTAGAVGAVELPDLAVIGRLSARPAPVAAFPLWSGCSSPVTGPSLRRFGR